MYVLLIFGSILCNRACLESITVITLLGLSSIKNKSLCWWKELSIISGFNIVFHKMDLSHCRENLLGVKGLSTRCNFHTANEISFAIYVAVPSLLIITFSSLCSSRSTQQFIFLPLVE